MQGNGDRDELLELIAQIERWQLELMTPKNFDSRDTDNYLKRLELSFESLCTSLEELGVKDPQALTVFQFYNKLSYFEKKRLKQKAK